MNQLEGTFNSIYKRGLWGNGASKSGSGSDPEVAYPYVSFVGGLIDRLDVEKVLDIGHGDWKMWPKDAFKGIEYLGIDAASDISTQVSFEFASEMREFRSGDATAMELPNADLLLCKDVLQHLSNEKIDLLLCKFQRFRNVVIVNDREVKPKNFGQALRMYRYRFAPRARLSLLRDGKNPFQRVIKEQNSDIDNGQYRCLDLLKNPWNLSHYNFELVETFQFASSKLSWIGTEKQVLVLKSNQS